MSVPRCHENTAGRGSVELGANLFIPDLWKLNFAIPPDDRPAKYRSLPLPSGLAHKRHADERISSLVPTANRTSFPAIQRSYYLPSRLSQRGSVMLALTRNRIAIGLSLVPYSLLTRPALLRPQKARLPASVPRTVLAVVLVVPACFLACRAWPVALTGNFALFGLIAPAVASKPGVVARA